MPPSIISMEGENGEPLAQCRCRMHADAFVGKKNIAEPQDSTRGPSQPGKDIPERLKERKTFFNLHQRLFPFLAGHELVSAEDRSHGPVLFSAVQIPSDINVDKREGREENT